MERNGNPVVLIVDDNPQNLRVCSQMLAGMGIETLIAMDGLQALDSVRSMPPDLVLLDIHMPRMDGYECCRRLKADPNFSQIPVIFLSAMNDEFNKVLAFECGAIDYISKPFQVEEVKSRISTHLQIAHQRVEMLKMMSELQAMNRTIGELLQIVTHDLSNPIGIILNDIAHLNNLSDPQQVKRVKRIAESATLAHGLIDCVREWRRIDSQGVKLEFSNLLNEIQRAVAVLDNRLQSKEIKLEIDIAPDLETMVEKRSFSLSVISNILINAIKFSHPGGKIQISAEVHAGLLQLRISDQGVGIPQNDLNKLFDAGKSQSRIGTSGEQGTGFGLSIVKRLMDAYEGSISVNSVAEIDSPDSHGTIITLTFTRWRAGSAVAH
jgi:two-component system, sensor histidine kinase and response regulator